MFFTFGLTCIFWGDCTESTAAIRGRPNADGTLIVGTGTKYEVGLPGSIRCPAYRSLLYCRPMRKFNDITVLYYV